MLCDLNSFQKMIFVKKKKKEKSCHYAFSEGMQFETFTCVRSRIVRRRIDDNGPISKYGVIFNRRRHARMQCEN